MSNKMKFKKDKLSELRILSGKTMEELAESVGIKNKASISRWEAGDQPSPRSLKKLSKFFKVPISVFFLLLMAFPAHADVDRDAAIRTIVGEAANQGPDGMTAVGELIRTRGSIRGFYGYKAMEKRTESKSVWDAATKAWDRSAISNLTSHATLMENVSAFGFPKSWDRSKVICVAQIKDHWFFIES